MKKSVKVLVMVFVMVLVVGLGVALGLNLSQRRWSTRSEGEFYAKNNNIVESYDTYDTDIFGNKYNVIHHEVYNADIPMTH